MTDKQKVEKIIKNLKILNIKTKDKDNSEDEEGEGHMMNNGIMMDLASKLLYENLYDKLIVIKDNL